MKKSLLLQITALILFLLAIVWGFINREPQNVKTFSEDKSNAELRYFYEKAQTLRGQDPSATKTVSFLAVGDIMLSRNVGAEIKKAGDPALPFSQVQSLISSVDFAYGNLESPMSGKNFEVPTGSLIFNAATSSIEGLIKNKFKVLQLANNHALDQGLKGLIFTKNFLKEKGLLTYGVGENLTEAWQPAVQEHNGIKTCFVGASYASINDSGKTVNENVARIEDIDLLKSSISNLKSFCDFIVATMHAGTEYMRTPNQNQTEFAHAAIDAGADMVIGHHPHWIQTTEKYQGKYIFYSLGNFIFDQMWSQDTKEGLALKITLSKIPAPRLQGTPVPAKLEKLELVPVIIENYSTPRLANEVESLRILKKIDLETKILK
jgi:poly-gamma-glutamate synthesis protein (capsule biosynthesis protein)